MLLYLDNAATTRISQEVLEEMKKSLEHYGNTESKYYYCAEAAKKDVATARRRVANSIGCKVDEVIFTSGATESNNLILRGYAEANPRKKKIIISSIEHSSIEVPCEYLASKGYEIVKIPVDHTGLVDLDLLDKNIDDNTLLVSIIWVNNEIGTIQNIAAIDKICSKHNIFWHSDATQAVGKVDINLNKYSNLKFLTLTSHKIYGPKGIGALVIRKDNEKRIEVCSQIKGGDQEYGYRAGTLSNELIVGFGKACELVAEDINSSNEHLSCLEKKFIEKIRMYCLRKGFSISEIDEVLERESI